MHDSRAHLKGHAMSVLGNNIDLIDRAYELFRVAENLLRNVDGDSRVNYFSNIQPASFLATITQDPLSFII